MYIYDNTKIILKEINYNQAFYKIFDEIISNSMDQHTRTIHSKENKEKGIIVMNKLEININSLYDFYGDKDCYYIQIGGYGFYHLKQDILSLSTPQFACKMKLRLRAKTIHSTPVYKYGFYAVLKVDKKEKPQKSCYDLEQKDGRKFPPII